MFSVLIIIHVIMCFILILVVLLQTGKGADMGAAFGGASQTLFGSAGPTGFLGKMTTVAAIIFMVTSLTLAWWSSNRKAASLIPALKEEKVNSKSRINKGGEPAKQKEIPPQSR